VILDVKKTNNGSMKQAMIFAAGLGTRLKPLTDTKPKALVEVAGKPLLQHVMEKLAGANVSHIVINVHHFAAQIIDFLREKKFASVDIRVSDETKELLDTGGGVRNAAPLFLPDAPILIHNVDILSNADLQELYSRLGDDDALLLVSERSTSRYLLFDEQMSLVGWTNRATGEVRSPHEDLDVNACRAYAFAGIHVLSPRLLPLMELFPERFGIIDFYLQLCAEHKIRGLLQRDLRLIDVGKLDSLSQAEEFLRSNM